MARARVGPAAVLALCLGILAAGLFVGITFSQVTGRCSAPTIIGGLIEGFSARATVSDGSTLTGRVEADQAAAVRVGQEVSVDQPLAETAVNAWIVALRGNEFTASVDPPPWVAVVSSPAPGILRSGRSGTVEVDTIAVSKTLLTPTAALTPVPGRPGLATELIGGYGAPVERELRRVEAIEGDFALAELTDDATAAGLGIRSPTRDRGWYGVIVPDRLCRVAALWPPVLDGPRTARIAENR
ncbi:hypothetical protein [Actinomycetospora corticicola]|uniref:HlyD family secretion protein n=1 Tax=Actinomycetospora corticicola TaxID=663602 RepID=A0A7Y9DXZ7_9PSEU|nr:hypothetical protein [Actinomycetospora corticicola]NYD37530.1 hypothetical protein [Actinomycetospora corticicola]